jgi:HPt (histidine-containing phosphotransfer) domain-containing protein
MSEPILDPTAIERLRRIGGDRLLRAMITSFMDNGAARVASAQGAARAGNAQGVSDAAHALKSSAGNIGAETLRLVTQKVERESLESGASLDALVAEMADAFETARVAVTRTRDAMG